MTDEIPRARVLIIEDDPALSRGLADNFADAGHDVQHARDGQQGLDMAVAVKPDLIILDIMLPEMNGYHVCREIRRKGIQTRVLMLTAKGQEDDIIRGLETGADDYVTKPFSLRELLARAHALLRRDQTRQQPKQLFGPFVLDDANRMLTCGQEPIELTSKEFGVLAYLLKHRGQPRTRQQILQSVWDDQWVVTRRSVDRCITTLRRKLKQGAPDHDFIQTVREIGYRFIQRESDIEEAD